MKIIWHGKTCFEILHSDKNKEVVSVLIDSTGTEYPKKENNILILTHAAEYNKKEKPFLISKAGEYEVQEIFIQGIPTSKENTIFFLRIDGIKICHLGIFNEKELTDDQVKELGRIDVLIIPAKEDNQTKIISQLEPSFVIPMDYNNETKDAFLKRLGEGSIAPEDVFKIQKKAFDASEKTEVVILNEK